MRETAARGGRVLIPAFAVGRTQELVYDLHALARAGRDPAHPDLHRQPARHRRRPTVFERNAELFDQSEAPVREIDGLFSFDLLDASRNNVERVEGAQQRATGR